MPYSNREQTVLRVAQALDPTIETYEQAAALAADLAAARPESNTPKTLTQAA